MSQHSRIAEIAKALRQYGYGDLDPVISGWYLADWLQQVKEAMVEIFRVLVGNVLWSAELIDTE